MNNKGELADCGQAHPPTGVREAGRLQPEPEGERNLGPRDGILHQTVSRLPDANQIFLGPWMVDICQEGRSLRSDPRGDIGHT